MRATTAGVLLVMGMGIALYSGYVIGKAGGL